jgi:hypothetical protein
MAAPLTPSLDPQRIEAEIAQLRERQSTAFGGGVKTNLFNLVVVSLPGGRPEEALEVLTGRRPARIIRLAPGPDGPAGASVSGRCFPGTLDRGVCLEEIDIAAPGDPFGSGAGAWTPLLARDIPTFLWIAGPWTPADLPREAAAHADKLIVDSSGVGDPPAALAALHRLREATHRRLVAADLAWSRTLPLRVQTARVFDPPGARDALDRLAGVRLEGGTRSEALLFFLWLATRLGWRQITGHGDPSFEDASRRTVSLVHGNRGPLDRGARLSFDIRGASGIEVVCSPDGCASVAEDRGPWWPAPDGELLLAEIDSVKQDALFDDALGMAGAAAAAVTSAAGSGAGDRGP